MRETHGAGDNHKRVEASRRILQLNDEAYASMSDDVLTVRLGVAYDFLGRDFAAWTSLFKNRHPPVGLEIEANRSENPMRAASAATSTWGPKPLTARPCPREGRGPTRC
jgi:hypothetical protein